MTTVARKRLAALRPIADPDLRPIVTDVAAFIEAIDAFAGGRGSPANVLARAEKVDQRFAELNSDPKFVEKLIRDGY